MKIYMLIPFMVGETVEMKEREGYTSKGALVREYSKRFGEKNKYYVDLSFVDLWKTSESKNMYYNNCQKSYFYDAFRPCDITRR